MKKYDHISQADYETVAGPDWPLFSQFQSHVGIPNFVYAELDEMIRPPQGFSHPSFCVLPFYAIEYPRKTPCCLMSDFDNLEEIRSDMLAGQRPQSCNACWRLEDSGSKSDRQLKNESMDFYTDMDVEQLLTECHQKLNKITHYKIDTSNTCNAACTTCSGDSSSTWNKIYQKNNLEILPNWKITPQQTHDWVDYPNAKSIIFRGGESFLSDTNFYILEQLLANNNTNCFVSFVTNGSFSLSKYQKNIISKFSNVNFCFSIDGVGPVFEYLRWPLKWDKIKHNISWCLDHNITPSVSYTLSNVNLLYHPQTTKWFKDSNLKYLVNPVYTPECFRPQSLPATVKTRLGQLPGFDHLQYFFKHDDHNDQWYEEFKTQIALQDSMKNIAIKDYLPELVELLKW